jgi:hypothetical protein
MRFVNFVRIAFVFRDFSSPFQASTWSYSRNHANTSVNFLYYQFANCLVFQFVQLDLGKREYELVQVIGRCYRNAVRDFVFPTVRWSCDVLSFCFEQNCLISDVYVTATIFFLNPQGSSYCLYEELREYWGVPLFSSTFFFIKYDEKNSRVRVIS